MLSLRLSTIYAEWHILNIKNLAISVNTVWSIVTVFIVYPSEYHLHPKTSREMSASWQIYQVLCAWFMTSRYDTFSVYYWCGIHLQLLKPDGLIASLDRGTINCLKRLEASSIPSASLTAANPPLKRCSIFLTRISTFTWSAALGTRSVHARLVGDEGRVLHTRIDSLV